MDLISTIIALGLSVAAMVVCGWRGALPPNPLKGPRLTPWRFLMVGAAAAALLLLIHLTALLGAERPPWIAPPR